MSRSTGQRYATITSIDHVIGWGKYRNKSIRDVMEIDPRYLEWAIATVDHFDVDHKVEDAIAEAAKVWKP